MPTARSGHAAVYHWDHVYVLGGYNLTRLAQCERYVCAQSRWQLLPPLPRPCSATNTVVLENSLYALGGYADASIDMVQRLSLDRLTWELMQLRLPQVGSSNVRKTQESTC
jgi:hypothetical protein